MKIGNYYRGNFCKSSPGDLLQQGNKQSGLENSFLKPKEKTVSILQQKHTFSTQAKALWWAGVVELLRQAAAYCLSFRQNLFSGFFLKSEYQFLMFQGTQKSDIVLIIDQDHCEGRFESVQNSGPGLSIEFLTITTH